MHEYSQTATQIDWQQFPYMYAAADSTPLFILAVLDYVRASGDVQFLKDHRDAVEKAWAFETDPAHDTDHDGIYDNSQGTGWVESWPGGMPHQEIYLAELDQQASTAYGELQKLLGNDAESQKAAGRAHDVAAKIEQEYYDPQKGCYAFATNPAGTANSPVDRTTTMYPALAWWSGFNPQPLAHGDSCLQQLAEHTLDTDWGLRDVSNEEKIYDGMSYHQGSVWPLFTGWAALAEYRGGQPLAGYRMLMQNANLTWAQDLGADTELLSGDFFVPFGRSTSHQLWSSAMVITPTLRGLFGISVDAQKKTITVDPHLPATWDTAIVKGIAVGQSKVDLVFHQSPDTLSVAILKPENSDVRLVSAGSAEKQDADGRVLMPRRVVAVAPWTQSLAPGDRTHLVRVTHENYSRGKLVLSVEGPSGSDELIPLVIESPTLALHAEGAGLAGKSLRKGMDSVAATQLLAVHFPSGTGWQSITVTLTW
jgi:glycogen debranching enzyme